MPSYADIRKTNKTISKLLKSAKQFLAKNPGEHVIPYYNPRTRVDFEHLQK